VRGNIAVEPKTFVARYAPDPPGRTVPGAVADPVRSSVAVNGPDDPNLAVTATQPDRARQSDAGGRIDAAAPTADPGKLPEGL
jgi:hypothetical protein